MKERTSTELLFAAAFGLGLTACDPGGSDDDLDFRKKDEIVNTGSRNLHLQSTVRLNPTQPGADADNGRTLFGLAADLETSDPSNALFEGASQVFGGNVVSNGRTCFTCHRGISEQLSLPPPPLSDHVAADDVLFTEINADAGGDPDAPGNLENHGLVKYRPNRFDPRPSAAGPYHEAFAWRKSPALINIGLSVGFLNDLRGRVMFETARGAVFSHTQSTDNRFDDLFSLQMGSDMEAFLFSDATLSDTTLAALRDQNDPMYETLVEDPFYTVTTTTHAEKRGKHVFVEKCMDCHNMPNVFGNMDNVEALANGDRPPNFPSWAPAVGRTFNVGVAEANMNGLRFTKYNGPGDFSTVVLPLAAENGDVVMHEIETDLGLALTTGRAADIGRFKVPLLRGVINNAPYFHDNSAATLADVIDYFNSDAYNDSRDGQDHPIHMNAQQRADLLAFLSIL